MDTSTDLIGAGNCSRWKRIQYADYGMRKSAHSTGGPDEVKGMNIDWVGAVELTRSQTENQATNTHKGYDV